MNKRSLLLTALLTGLTATAALAQGDSHAIIEVQMYNRAIHIMAMLLIGFGFLMVFVRGYGLSALTATYLMVAAAVPGYFLLKTSGWFGHAAHGIEGLILTEFAAASLLICAGAWWLPAPSSTPAEFPTCMAFRVCSVVWRRWFL